MLTAVFLIFINPILYLFGATDILLPYALDYGYIIGIGLPFMMISAAVNSMIRADGSPKYAMLSMVIGAVLNVILDPVFIFIFEMGVKGAAIATVAGQVASFIVSVVYMPRFKTIRLDSASFRLKAKSCGNIVVFGLSSFITQFAITIVMALTNNLLATYGANSVYGAKIPLTATGIVMKVNQIMIAVLLGIATGAQPIIGFNYGAKNFRRVIKIKTCIIFKSVKYTFLIRHSLAILFYHSANKAERLLQPIYLIIRIYGEIQRRSPLNPPKEFQILPCRYQSKAKPFRPFHL